MHLIRTSAYTHVRTCNVQFSKERRREICSRVYIRVKILSEFLRVKRRSVSERGVLLMQPHDRAIAMRREETGSEEDPAPRRGAPSRVSL